MGIQVDFREQKTSWTKYDIVQVIEVIDSIEIIENFKSKKAIINEPILRSFLGIKSIEDPIPSYWIEIQNFPKEKRLFALLAALFTHGGVINDFAFKYSTGDMKGLFKIEPGKQYTNIRSALIEGGAAKPIYRRTSTVPYDFSPILQNGQVGKLFKELLIERISRFTKVPLEDEDFYDVCFINNFHSAISLTKDQFKAWLEGLIDINNHHVNNLIVTNFFSIEEAILNFNNSKEIYFLGENGDGKSLVLMALYLAFNGNYIIEKTDQERTGKVTDIIRNNKNIGLRGIDDNGQEYDLQKSIFLKNMFAYGTHRGRYSTDKPEEYGFMSLFDSEQTLVNPVSWLKDQKLLELQTKSSSNKGFLPINLLEKIFYELLEKNVEIKFEGDSVKFKEKGTLLNFDQLSEGYKSILIFGCDLIYRLQKNAEEGVSAFHQKGVVLIDEIDVHLHLKWQRLIVSKLRNLFPRLQFILTTHSPTIIQGASEDALLFRVFRNKEDGKTRISEPYLRREIDHLMINSLITSPLFGMLDSRMNPRNDDSDTSESYLIYRINKKLEKELINQRDSGKNFIDDSTIDKLIEEILKDELGKNDQEGQKS